MKTRTKLIFGTLGIAGILGVAAAATSSHADGGWGHGDGGMRGGPGMSMMFERFDTNGDGKITLEEANGTIDTKLADFDADGNGTLSLDEFQGLYLDQTRQMMVRGFQRFDRDGDGQLSREELGAPVEMIFGRMDANDDGAIEKSEMRKRGDGRHGDRDGKGRRGDN